MLIAVSAGGREPLSAVKKFETCRWLLFIETDNKSIDAVRNDERTTAEDLAQMVVERDCEAVITASFNADIFNIIADACITRYNGAGLTVQESIDRMDSNTLEYIRYADKDDTCHGDHSGGDCNCGVHDDE